MRQKMKHVNAVTAAIALFVMTAMVLSVGSARAAASYTAPEVWDFGSDAGKFDITDSSISDNHWTWNDLGSSSIQSNAVRLTVDANQETVGYTTTVDGMDTGDFEVNVEWTAHDNWTNNGNAFTMRWGHGKYFSHSGSGGLQMGQDYKERNISITGDALIEDGDKITYNLTGTPSGGDTLYELDMEIERGGTTYTFSGSDTWTGSPDEEATDFGLRTTDAPPYSADIHSFSVVPEPSSLLLLGLAGLLLMKRRRV